MSELVRASLQKLDRYNGWINYPTWAVHLWLTNEEELYKAALEAIEIAKVDGRSLAEALREFVERYVVADVLESTSLAADLVGFVLEYVDWSEIVKALTGK